MRSYHPAKILKIWFFLLCTVEKFKFSEFLLHDKTISTLTVRSNFFLLTEQIWFKCEFRKVFYLMVEGKDILESGVDLHNKCLLRVKSRLFLSLTLTQKGPQLFSTSFPLISAVLHICYLFAPVLSVLKDFTPCVHFYWSPMRDFWNIAVVFTFYIHQSYTKPHNDSKWQVLGHNCFNMM